MPCSAEIVTGIVCEAETAFWLVVSDTRRYSVSNDPDP